MANSLRAKISKLRHDGKISDSEYQELIKKLDGHDAKVREDFKEEKCDKCDYFISVEEAYKQGGEDAIDECINTIVGTQSQIALNEPYDEHLFTVMADRQHEIIDLMEQLKEKYSG